MLLSAEEFQGLAVDSLDKMRFVSCTLQARHQNDRRQQCGAKHFCKEAGGHLRSSYSWAGIAIGGTPVVYHCHHEQEPLKSLGANFRLVDTCRGTSKSLSVKIHHSRTLNIGCGHKLKCHRSMKRGRGNSQLLSMSNAWEKTLVKWKSGY